MNDKNSNYNFKLLNYDYVTSSILISFIIYVLLGISGFVFKYIPTFWKCYSVFLIALFYINQFIFYFHNFEDEYESVKKILK